MNTTNNQSWNKLKISTTTTEFIMFGSKAQLSKWSTKQIDKAGDKIPNVTVIRYVGAYLDEGLKFSTHVKTKCRTAMLNYFRIKNIRKYLTQDSTKILVLSLVISHLDYCNAILFWISESELQKLQRIQNMCAKHVLQRRKYDSFEDSLF